MEYDLPPPPPPLLQSADESSSSSEEDEFDLPPPPSLPPPPPAHEPSDQKKKKISMWLDGDHSEWLDEGIIQQEKRPNDDDFTLQAAAAPASSSASLASSASSSSPSSAAPTTSTKTTRTSQNKRTRTRRRSSVMDLVGQFRRGSLEQQRASKLREEEARKHMETELSEIAPSTTSPSPSSVLVLQKEKAETNDNINAVPGRTSARKSDMLASRTSAGSNSTTQHRRTSYVPESPTSPTEWQEMTDPGSGHSYWYNTRTQESSWTKPTQSNTHTQHVHSHTHDAGRSVTEAGHSSGWTEVHDDASGRTYWYNTSTGESSWTAPSSTPSTSVATRESNGFDTTRPVSAAPDAAISSASLVAASIQDKQMIAKMEAQIGTLKHRLHAEEDARLDETSRMSRRVSTLIARATNSISLEEHRKSMQGESERVSTLIDRLTAKNDELHQELERSREESMMIENKLKEELAQLKRSASMTTISMKDERMNDMEDELANALSHIERLQHERRTMVEEQTLVEHAFQKSETKCASLEKLVEELTPKEMTEKEQEQKLAEEQSAKENQKQQDEHLRLLVSCVEYFAHTGLPALEDACDASKMLNDLLVHAAPRAAYAASGSSGQPSSSGLLKRVVDDRLTEQEARHRAEVQELEKMSGDALNSMARGWADAQNNQKNTIYLNGDGEDVGARGSGGGTVGQGPQVELFIWKAAMKVSVFLS